MMLNLVKTTLPILKRVLEGKNLGVMLIFFDGEEAFVNWSDKVKRGELENPFEVVHRVFDCRIQSMVRDIWRGNWSRPSTRMEMNSIEW
jgi:hypothetical protein